MAAKFRPRNFNLRMPQVAIRDPQNQLKRQRQQHRLATLKSQRPASTPSGEVPGFVQQLRDALYGSIHPWWQHLPSHKQNRPHRLRIILRRCGAWIKLRPQRIGICLIVYLMICGFPLLWELPLISIVALLPLILVPPVGYLIYRLVWAEFHF